MVGGVDMERENVNEKEETGIARMLRVGVDLVMVKDGTCVKDQRRPDKVYRRYVAGHLGGRIC